MVSDVFILMPAYNAASTIEKVLDRIPRRGEGENPALRCGRRWQHRRYRGRPGAFARAVSVAGDSGPRCQPGIRRRGKDAPRLCAGTGGGRRDRVTFRWPVLTRADSRSVAAIR